MSAIHCEISAVFTEDNALQDDILSLMDGVLLRLVPDETPDYEHVRYYVLSSDDSDEGTVHAAEDATLIMDAERVKATLTPIFAGTYTLATLSN